MATASPTTTLTVRYRAMHDYVPEGDEVTRGYIFILPDDTLEVRDPEGAEDFAGTVREPNCWLRGTNLRTGAEGLFPGNYVTFVEIVQPPSPLRPSSLPPKLPILPGRPGSSKAKPQVTGSHTLVNAYFSQPVLCGACNDYIWNGDKPGLRCQACGQVYHATCRMSTASPCPLKTDPNAASPPPTSDTPQVVQQWPVKSVLEWMAAARLEPFIDIFRARDVTGETLTSLTVAGLQDLGVTEASQQMAILLAVDELLNRQVTEVKYKNDLPFPQARLMPNEGQQLKDHRFVSRSFLSPERCQMCDKFLVGTSRQALRCTGCDLTCHRQCAVTGLPACCLPPADMASTPDGTAATSDAAAGGRSLASIAPIVEACMAHLEKSDVTLLSLYKECSETDKLHTLLHDLALDVRAVDLNSYASAVIAGAVRVCLADMSESILPEHLYDKFIESAGDSTGQGVLSLVGQLPQANRDMLRIVMAHVCRACAQHGADKASCDDAALLFSSLILRPAWHRAVEVAKNSEEQSRVFDQLLRHGDWGVSLTAPPPRPPPRKAAPPSASPPMPTPSISRPPSVTGSVAEGSGSSNGSSNGGATGINGAILRHSPSSAGDRQSLTGYDWYWSKITREEANDLMKDAPDGSFLVRDATSGNAKDYTLTLRMGGSNKLIKIYHQNGRYGFVNEKMFDSVGELVSFYTHNTLADYNRNLNVCLMYPVCKTPGDFELGFDEKKVKGELRRLNRDYLQKTGQYDANFEEQQQISQQIQMKQQALEAFKATVTVFEDQLKLHVTFRNQALPHEMNKLQENYDLLETRLREIRDSKSRLEDDVKLQTNKLRDLATNMNLLKPDIKQLHRSREMYKTWLLDHDVPADKVEELLEEDVKPGESPTLPPIAEEDIPHLHMNQDNWLMDGWERAQADMSLANKPPGTFLLRPRTESNKPYALSMKTLNGIGHALVLRNDAGLFGFSEPYCMFTTLLDLVLYYRTHSLAVHNESLDVTLQFPIHATTSVSSSSSSSLSSASSTSTIVSSGGNATYVTR